MKWIHFAISTFFITTCDARTNDHRSLRSSFDTISDCLKDGFACKEDECGSCCSGNIIVNGTSVCGSLLSVCNGTACDVITSGNDGDNGTSFNASFTDECLPIGSKCDGNTTCFSCCNANYFPKEDNTYECGCMEDGTKCLPDQTCPYCCNGAYEDNGYTCGGTCKQDGEECTYGEDCYKCCNTATYWYTKEKFYCGWEPCYEDGASCIPNQSCGNCCSGGAYGDDDTKCGGKACLEADTECDFLTTCNKCCDQTSYWDVKAESMKCGFPFCYEDGTPCIPGKTCTYCCNGAYDDMGTKCGGTALETGTKCDYYTTCNICRATFKFNQDTGSYECSNYGEWDTLHF